MSIMKHRSNSIRRWSFGRRCNPCFLGCAFTALNQYLLGHTLCLCGRLTLERMKTETSWAMCVSFCRSIMANYPLWSIHIQQMEIMQIILGILSGLDQLWICDCRGGKGFKRSYWFVSLGRAQSGTAWYGSTATNGNSKPVGVFVRVSSLFQQITRMFDVNYWFWTPVPVYTKELYVEHNARLYKYGYSGVGFYQYTTVQCTVLE